MNDAPSDIIFHYPPELFNLLVDVVPLLNRSKQDVLVFFRGAGVPDNITSDIAVHLRLHQRMSTSTRWFARYLNASTRRGTRSP